MSKPPYQPLYKPYKTSDEEYEEAVKEWENEKYEELVKECEKEEYEEAVKEWQEEGQIETKENNPIIILTVEEIYNLAIYAGLVIDEKSCDDRESKIAIYKNGNKKDWRVIR